MLFLAAAGITLGFAVAAVIMMAAMVPVGFGLFLAIGLGFGRLFGFFSLGLLLGFGCLGSFRSGILLALGTGLPVSPTGALLGCFSVGFFGFKWR